MSETKQKKRIKTVAPGRAELLGNHTDYNQGLVLSLAISVGTTVEGEEREGKALHLESLDLKEKWEGHLDSLEVLKDKTWANYLIGVADELKKRKIEIGGAELEVSTSIPIGAGLSSSAALEIATALSFQKLYPFELEPLEMAKVAQAAEHRYAGVKCGLLEQISVLMSKKDHATFIDCRSYEIQPLPLDPSFLFVIIHSGVKHALTAGEYNERRESCEAATQLLGKQALREVSREELESAKSTLPEKAYKRARHVVGENERVSRAVELLNKGDMEAFGKLMWESHESSIVHFENSCPELDFLVERASDKKGCCGARLSGGGFGGATINVVKKEAADTFSQSMAEDYEKKYGKRPLILKTEACDGAK